MESDDNHYQGSKSPSQTQLAHAGRGADATGALSVPIYQTSTFEAPTAEQLARDCVASGPAQLYTRWGNPTTAALERAAAKLEGGERAVAFASGMGAISAAVLASVTGGDHIVAGPSLYGGTTELLNDLLPTWGIQTTFAATPAAEAFEAAMRPNTRLVYVETPANPTLALTDIEAVAAVAHQRGAQVVVDNTYASPWNQQPLSLGADAVVHSATKYLAGHSDVISGLAIGSETWAHQVWMRLKLLGACPSPHDAWLVIRGMKTLGLRVARQNATAEAVATYLEAHPQVERVHYPGLTSHPDHGLASRQMRGYGGMVAFEVTGGRERAQALTDGLSLIARAASLGGPETLAVHPASTTHAHVDSAARRRAGLADGLIRLSIGLEEPGDLIDDLDRALSSHRRGPSL